MTCTCVSVRRILRCDVVDVFVNHRFPTNRTEVKKTGSLFNVNVSPTSEVIVQELCGSQGGRPGQFALTSLLVTVDVKLY